MRYAASRHRWPAKRGFGPQSLMTPLRSGAGKTRASKQTTNQTHNNSNNRLAACKLAKVCPGLWPIDQPAGRLKHPDNRCPVAGLAARGGSCATMPPPWLSLVAPSPPPSSSSSYPSSRASPRWRCDSRRSRWTTPLDCNV